MTAETNLKEKPEETQDQEANEKTELTENQELETASPVQDTRPKESGEPAAPSEEDDIDLSNIKIDNSPKPHEIDFKEFFREILIPFTAPEIVNDCIKVLIPGDAQASDFEEIIEKEAEMVRIQQQVEALMDSKSLTPVKKTKRQTFKSLFIMLVNSMGLANEISNIKHTIGMLGLVQVRNAIMGMSLYQHFNPKKQLRFDKIAGGEIEQTIQYALESENFVKDNNCQTHLAFIPGLIFDLIANIIASKKQAFTLLSGPLKKPDDFFEDLWRHSLAVGYTCDFLMKRCKAKIHLGRFSYVAGLLHDLGKLGLMAYSPKVYNEIVKTRLETMDPFSDLEEAQFGFPHETITALMLRKINVFTEIELSIDHHHDHDLLAIRNPDMHRLAALIELADAIVHNTLGFIDKTTDIDIVNMPARLIIKLEKHFIEAAMANIKRLKF